MSALEIISQDLDWREAELGSLKLLLARRDVTDHQKVVLLRACWALLYAHYEGFVKNALTVFFDYAKNAVIDCGSLPEKTRLFALKKKLGELRNLSQINFLNQIEEFSTNYISHKPTFPDVDTKSNLWPNVLQEILDAADIHLSSLESHKASIKTLVYKRNGIAHGQRELIKEVDYYRKYEQAVYEIMYDLSFSINDRLNRYPYL